MASRRARTRQLIVSKLRREIFLYLVSQKGRSSFSPRLGFSLCLLLPLLKGEPVMWSCQPPTQTVYYNQCRLCWREQKCVQVCAHCMCLSLRLASLIKVAWAVRALVTVCLVRTLRTAVLMKADCTVQYTHSCTTDTSRHAQKVIWKSPSFSRFDLFSPQMLLDLSYL